ncbi:PREDICTED: formin-like protein 1 [Tarenaya hassleriana]|uniref:formin-like protein 1 n=1 Tax=Tarenaya hassleriana TaxID=28532 RepID=UPI00053C0B27|nr:PREDICTED: formin-like protein 1 [Tarenaya hassleriana]
MAETSSKSKKTHQIQKEGENPSKFYTHFLFKAFAVTLFCVIVPLFTSQSPDLNNQTRLLELLHLVFVGIAVSYGLFSRRNYDGGGGRKENAVHGNNHRFENAHSYLSRILHVSSVFDDDHDNNGNESEPSDESAAGGYSKVQTWRNRYQMNSSEVVLAKDHEAVVGQVSSKIREKPLLLPVRSLNLSRVSDSGENLTVSGVNSDRRRQLYKSLSENSVNHNNVVLPSPIPWGSRSSGIESQPLIRSEAAIESLPMINSPKKSTPLANSYTESLAKSAEDSWRKNSFYGGFHPPPPPPPPPPFHKAAAKKDLSGGYRIERKESNHKMKLAEGSSKTFRTARSEAFSPPPPPPPPPLEFYKSIPAKPRVSELRVTSNHETMPSENSIRRVRWGDPIINGSNQGRILGKGSVESPKKNKGYDPEMGKEAEKLGFGDRRDYLRNKTYKDFHEKRLDETDEEDSYSSEEDEMDDTGARSLDSQILGRSDMDGKSRREEEDGGSHSEGEEGRDVDKKADEFIAKFREQIRLQRIESIKRSAFACSNLSSRNPST